jgi:acyl-CoA thioesterase-1
MLNSLLNLILLIFVGLTPAWAQKSKKVSVAIDNKEKIVIIGDSLTDGYGIAKEKAFPALLQKEVKKQFPNIELVPSAISGSVTASASNRLLWLIKNQKNLKAVVVVLGGNDLIRGIKPETMKKGYQKLLDVAADAKLPVLLAPMPIPMNYELYHKDLEGIYNEIRENKKVTILENFFKGVVGVAALNQTDGIHPNELGHELITKNINQQVLDWIASIQNKKK